MTTVAPGQEWKVSTPTGRLFLRVLSVEGGMARVETTRRRVFTMAVATLEGGKRGAALVLNADGSTPPARPARAPARPSHRAVMALELREREGLSREAIASRFDVGIWTVDRWLSAARAAAEKRP